MNIFSKSIKWVMLVSGALTCTMIYAAIAPQAALLSTFGASISGPLAEIVVRNWGALITLIGAMLIYGALQPVHRHFILVVAVASKIVFITLVLTLGSQYLGKAGLAVVFDTVVVLYFLAYLASSRRAVGTAGH
ncbi:MAG: hypothetical protein Q8M51_08140 [Polaromonas sp.]|uniref:hypothetical protein n=1 Tax=Polaromonas sp. TaxID=1869339 RepID=UPI00273159A0|nr:hypothetical protein [Polaromonas sp.]MDP1742514.1 hypothetical protein [Polaromonas sp.]MDP1953236.1 hypothetical protein [Polaromonas sp.]MDP3355816.1 hypothetical protein [Polaromonas sp.]MDP3752389.1 hypothetical protein [Polaromonas sp.]